MQRTQVKGLQAAVAQGRGHTQSRCGGPLPWLPRPSAGITPARRGAGPRLRAEGPAAALCQRTVCGAPGAHGSRDGGVGTNAPQSNATAASRPGRPSRSSRCSKGPCSLPWSAQRPTGRRPPRVSEDTEARRVTSMGQGQTCSRAAPRTASEQQGGDEPFRPVLATAAGNHRQRGRGGGPWRFPPAGWRAPMCGTLTHSS